MRVICWSLTFMLLAGCGPAQTPPNPNESGMVVKATASDMYYGNVVHHMIM